MFWVKMICCKSAEFDSIEMEHANTNKLAVMWQPDQIVQLVVTRVKY